MISYVPDEDNESGEEDDSYADVLNVMTANMSVQQGRGLPPPPCGATISRDNPPLNPREMYAQSGIYQVIQDEKVRVCGAVLASVKALYNARMLNP